MNRLYLTLALTSFLCSLGQQGYAQLPADWSNTDIGNTPVAGSTTYDSASAVFTLAGSGTDFWTADDGHFAYASLIGDFSISVKILSFDGSLGSSAKAGINVRSSLNTSAVSILSAYESWGSMATVTRDTEAPEPTWEQGAPQTPPYFLRIVRSGNTFTTANSADGATWTNEISKTLTLMPDTVLAGLMVSPNSEELGTATFEAVDITGTIVTVTSLEDVQAHQPSVSLYPNPARDWVEVKVGEGPVKALTLLDMTGKVLRSQVPTGTHSRLEVSDLPSGMYLVQVRTLRGLSTQKLIRY